MTLYAATAPLLVVCPGCGSIVETVDRRRPADSNAVELTWPPTTPLTCCGDLERPSNEAVERATDRGALRVRARRAAAY